MTDSQLGSPSTVQATPPVVRRIVTVGMVLFWAAQLSLLFVAGLPLLDSVLLAVLLVAVPALSVAQLPLISGAPIERLPAYWSSIATLWLLGTACWFIGTREGGAAAVGLVPTSPTATVLWTVGLACGGLGTIFLFRQVGVWTGAVESPVLHRLLPRTREERRVFGVLSVAAGFGEEISYRGYVIPVLAPVLGVPGAAVLSSAVFGVLHGYQGLLGIARTTVMGGCSRGAFWHRAACGRRSSPTRSSTSWPACG